MTLNADLVRTRCQEIEDSLARLDKSNYEVLSVSPGELRSFSREIVKLI